MKGNVVGQGGKSRQGDNVALASSVSGTTLKLRAPAGIYDGTDDNVTLTDADFVASNIKSGVNLFGVAGSLNPLEAVAGNNVYAFNNDMVSNTTNSDTIAKTFTANLSGTLRVKWTHASTDGTTMWSSVYKNGSKVSSDFTTAGTTPQSYDVTVASGDVITIRHRISTPTGGRTSRISNASVSIAGTRIVSEIT